MRTSSIRGIRCASASRIPKGRPLVPILLLLLPSLRLGALETTLDWRVGARNVIFTQSVLARGDGFSAVITTNVGELDSLSLDGRRSTLEWRRSFESEGTDLVATRSGSLVRISGTYKRKPYDRTHDFGELPWYQFQEISYEALPGVESGRSSFWTIDRGSLRPSLFEARKGGSETIEVMGAPVAAVKYDLGLRGVPSFVFTAHFWLRESDGRMLRLDVPPILGLPRSRVDLTSESR